MKIAEQFTDWLITNGADIEDRELYIYGAECFINEVTSDIFLLLLGLLLGKLHAMIIWLVFFTIIRVNLGGYHAKSHTHCVLLSTALGGICVMIYPLFINQYLIMALGCLLSLIVVIWLAPVIHVNHPVSGERQKTIKKIALVISGLEILCVLYYVAHGSPLSAVIFVALISAIFLCVLGHFVNQRFP